jgi:hypothetical protein
MPADCEFSAIEFGGSLTIGQLYFKWFVSHTPRVMAETIVNLGTGSNA